MTQWGTYLGWIDGWCPKNYVNRPVKAEKQVPFYRGSSTGRFPKNLNEDLLRQSVLGHGRFGNQTVGCYWKDSTRLLIIDIDRDIEKLLSESIKLLGKSPTFILQNRVSYHIHLIYLFKRPTSLIHISKIREALKSIKVEVYPNRIGQGNPIRLPFSQNQILVDENFNPILPIPTFESQVEYVGMAIDLGESEIVFDVSDILTNLPEPLPKIEPKFISIKSQGNACQNHQKLLRNPEEDLNLEL